MVSITQIPMFIAPDIVIKMMRAEPIPACLAFYHSFYILDPFRVIVPVRQTRRLQESPFLGFEVCYNKMTHRCQSKTLSPPDFESTYTNKASLEACGVLISTSHDLTIKDALWRCVNLWEGLRLPFCCFSFPAPESGAHLSRCGCHLHIHNLTSAP